MVTTGVPPPCQPGGGSWSSSFWNFDRHRVGSPASSPQWSLRFDDFLVELAGTLGSAEGFVEAAEPLGNEAQAGTLARQSSRHPVFPETRVEFS